LRNSRKGNIAANTLRILEYLRDNVTTARFIDPANTNNVVSDDCAASEKSKIALQASASLGKNTWDEIVW
jgi:hypothetical protein